MKTFNQIKKHSESYAKMMRDNFPSSFEDENLNTILSNIVFNDEKKLFIETLEKENKMNDFKSFIYSLLDIEEEEKKENSKSVKTLLEEVGYDFYICDTVQSVLQFKKYYKSGEEICTFNNIKGRLSNYYVFWIVKKNVDAIEHQGSKKNRQDLYGTSCCSIQINKKNKNDLSIKNRYNHNVPNCDATFSNNLENIAEGLTQAFNIEFNLEVTKSKTTFELNNFLFNNGKFIYYNYEINNIYYGIDKYFKDGELTILDKTKFILIDYFLLDLRGHKIIRIDKNLTDGFFDLKFEKIIVKKKSSTGDDFSKNLIIIK